MIRTEGRDPRLAGAAAVTELNAGAGGSDSAGCGTRPQSTRADTFVLGPKRLARNPQQRFGRSKLISSHTESRDSLSTPRMFGGPLQAGAGRRLYLIS